MLSFVLQVCLLSPEAKHLHGIWQLLGRIACLDATLRLSQGHGVPDSDCLSNRAYPRGNTAKAIPPRRDMYGTCVPCEQASLAGHVRLATYNAT